jgi:3-oxoacyl-[acyl-carrier protein] reductase
MIDFTDKTFVVTGAAQGIGYQTAKGIVEGGGKVVILDLNEQKGKIAAESFNGSASFYKVDLGDAKNIREVIAQVIRETKDTISGLINVGGIVSTKKFQDISDAEWERTIRINLTGTYTTCSSLYSYFKEKGKGRIVNVSSVAGKIGGGLLGTAAYASSKAGVNGLTKAIAKEGGPFGVSCNAVCPSFTHTPMTTALSEDKEKNALVISMTPLRRAAEPNEIANMILFFASDLASYVNGEIGDCDGGIVLD